ncbi:Putative LOC101744434, partial [Caligus rogercresseyi]
DCAQYFTGISGEFESYNNAGDQALQSHNYQYCIRQEDGMCGIQYSSVEMDLDATIDAASQSVDATDADICPVTAIRIPGVVGALASEFCGSILSVGNEATVNGVLTTYTTPFSVSFFTATGTTLAGFNGFKLRYTQVSLPMGHIRVLFHIIGLYNAN